MQPASIRLPTGYLLYIVLYATEIREGSCVTISKPQTLSCHPPARDGFKVSGHSLQAPFPMYRDTFLMVSTEPDRF